MRAVPAVCFLATVGLTAAPAAADTFGGFSGVDRPYLVNQDKVCEPLPVTSGAAAGAPRCEKVGADVVAKLSIKSPIVQRGPKATFTASASGRTLTVARIAGGQVGSTVVTWSTTDPIGRIVEVYASQYGDRVAVAYTTRRLGREVTDVIAFELGRTTATAGDDPATVSADVSAKPSTTTSTPTDATDAAPKDPAVAKAVAAARKAPKKKQLAAWNAVLAADPAHSEALYQVAALQLGAKKQADALATLGRLAASTRADAIEWLVEARFDKSFASLRGVPAFREKVGLDRKAATPYERLMGFGGQWEQTGTACDKPEVRLTATRDRVVRIRVRTKCNGVGYDLPFKGTWRLDGDQVILTLPTKGKQVTAEDQAPCQFQSAGDEDALHCTLGGDLEFVVLPTRR